MRWSAALACLVVAASGACAAAPAGTEATSTHDRAVHGSIPIQGTRAVPLAGPADEVESEPRGSDDWRMTRFAEDGQIEGYSTAASGVPGTRLGLKVSTSERRFRVFAYRLGAYLGGTGHLVWTSPSVRGVQQADAVFEPAETRTVVAPWHRNLTIDTTGWVPGFYVLRLRTGSGWEYQIPYVVSSPTTSGTVALVVPVTTWQAYNIWGGYSLYSGPEGDRRSWAVSFDRPYQGVGGMNDFRTAVVPIVINAERSGVSLSYLANTDLEDSARLAGARGYVSMGHDEYWTLAMRATVLAARDSGTNLAFLGANTMYWRVRLEGGANVPVRLMTGYRDDAGQDPESDERPAEATARFRDAPLPRPENELTGMLYECYPVSTDYLVVTPGWWGFAGTGVRRGTAIPGLVGGESDRVYPNALTPRPLQVLSHTPFSCRGDATSSQSVYYTSPSGAGVFNAGTLRWGCALVDLCDVPLGPRTRDFTRRVTANLLRGFAAGPVGVRHPAEDNIAEFDLPLVNGVTAS